MNQRNVLITGSSKGLGEYLAKEFSKDKNHMIIHGRDEKSLTRIKYEIEEKGNSCSCVIGDLNEDSTLETLIKEARSHNTTVLINNAAITCPGLALDKLDHEKIQEMVNTNLLSPIRLTKGFYETLSGRDEGYIININSMAGIEPKLNRTLYCATKGGLKMFTDSLKLEAKNNNIYVKNVFLSKIKMYPEDKFGMDPNDVAKKIYQQTFLKLDEDIIIDGRPR